MSDENPSRRPELPLLSLTRQMGKGDDCAWSEFHQRYYVALLRHAAARTSRPDDASEIVQRAYLRIARHIKPFKEETGFWRWLLCVVRCAAVDHQRGLARRTSLLEKIAHWQETDRNTVELPGTTTFALAHEALAKLPPGDAQLLRLKYYEDWSLEQLAANTGTTAKAVENRLARLRQRLRQIILRIQ